MRDKIGILIFLLLIIAIFAMGAEVQKKDATPMPAKSPAPPAGARASAPPAPPGGATKAEAGMVPADAKQLWTYITVTDPYQGWAYWPGYEDLMPGKSPHGPWIKYYANGVAMKAAREGKEMMPDGAILVKENYDNDKKTLKFVTTLYKIKGYNPESGDWFWAANGPDGSVAAEGKVKTCMDCHAAMKAQDWRFLKYTKPMTMPAMK